MNDRTSMADASLTCMRNGTVYPLSSLPHVKSYMDEVMASSAPLLIRLAATMPVCGLTQRQKGVFATCAQALKQLRCLNRP
jgi:hypothetical protein